MLEEGLDDDEEADSKPAARPLTPGGPLTTSASTTRDHYGLNRPQSELRGASMDDNASVGASTFATATTMGTMSIRELARAERRAAKKARKELEAALASLPAPQYEYELEAPMDIDDDDEKKVETVMEDDMADVEAEERRLLQMEADKLYEARSSVVKRSELPRPFGAIPEAALVDSPTDTHEALINEERLTLLKHDAFAFPVEEPPSLLESSGDKKSKKKKKRKHDDASLLPPETPLEIISEEALDSAKALIQSEYDKVVEEKSQPLLADGKTLDDAMNMILDETSKSTRSSSSAGEVFVDGAWKDPNGDDKLLASSLALEFNTLQEATSTLHKKNEKVESKIAVLTGGLCKRAQNTATEILQLYHNLQNSKIEEAVYKNLKTQEDSGAVARIEQLRTSISRVKDDEERLQSNIPRTCCSTTTATTRTVESLINILV